MAVAAASMGAWMAANAGTIAAVSAATSVAATAASVYQQKQQADAQYEAASEQNKQAAMAAVESYDDLSPAEIDAQRNAAEQSLQNQVAAAQARGRVNVFAAAAGTQGKSVDTMLYDIDAIKNRNLNEILRQREAGLYSIKQQAEQTRYGAMQGMNKTAISRPSWLEGAFAVGSYAMQQYDKYMQKSPTFDRQKPATVKGGV